MIVNLLLLQLLVIQFYRGYYGSFQKLLTLKIIAGSLYHAFGQTEDLEAVFTLKERESRGQLLTADKAFLAACHIFAIPFISS